MWRESLTLLPPYVATWGEKRQQLNYTKVRFVECFVINPKEAHRKNGNNMQKWSLLRVLPYLKLVMIHQNILYFQFDRIFINQSTWAMVNIILTNLQVQLLILNNNKHCSVHITFSSHD